MIEWDKLLAEVLEDPVFANIKTVQHRATSSDRLVRSFEEILEFVEKNDRLPSPDGALSEKGLYARLEGIRNDANKRDKCLPFDRLNLLSTHKIKTEEDDLADILNDPIFDVAPEVAAIFDVPEYMRKAAEDKKQADYVGQHKECKDFEKYEGLFRSIHTDLRLGLKKTVTFKTEHLKQGGIFIMSGRLVYLAEMDDQKMRKTGDYKIDGRIRCIYENGTESDILLQTLSKNLYTDGYTVLDCSQDDNEHLRASFAVTDNDIASGYVYILKSHSIDPEIANKKDLYKIGFTTTSVESRIANARNEATYLFADVEIGASYKVYNIKAVAFESALHQLFDKVQLKLSAGKATPKEWYVVPFRIIDEAVTRLIQGERIGYDHHLQRLILAK